jgi:TatD DNase family protein
VKPIDTHAHLQFKVYNPDRKEVVKRNSEELEAVINVGAAIDSSKVAVELAKEIPNFYASVGVHPHHSDQWDRQSLEKLESLAQNEKVVAIGEIGLDLHQYEDQPKPQLKDQTKMLHEQIELSTKLNLPIIFHCRDAYEELFGEIEQFKGKIKGVVHCFLGNADQAKRFLDLGLYLSFTGNITYKGNGWLREIAKGVPGDKTLIETDAPYLPPEPHRGERNEPIYVKIVANKLAEIRKKALEDLIEQTNHNSKTLFKI